MHTRGRLSWTRLGRIGALCTALWGLTLTISQGNGVIPTNTWVDLYSTDSTFAGQPVQAGVYIAAFDPEGVQCGEFTVRVPGWYGIMPCYGDDTTAPPDEGAVSGDVLHFSIDGWAATPQPITLNGTPVPPDTVVTWTQSGDRWEVNLGVPPTPTPTATPTTGQVAGWIFVDTNGDGWRQLSETDGIAGVWVHARQGANTYSSRSVGVAGWYAIPNLPPGNYVISEDQPAGYISTSPDLVQAAVSAGVQGIVNFGELRSTSTSTPTATPTRTQTPTATATPTWTSTPSPVTSGCITGRKVDESHVGLPGWYIYAKPSGSHGPILATVTDESGIFTFGGLTPGQWTVWEAMREGWSWITAPVLDLALSGGPDCVEVSFMNRHATVTPTPTPTSTYTETPTPSATPTPPSSGGTGAIHGVVWHDRSRDGRLDLGETGLAGFQVRLLPLQDQPTGEGTPRAALTDSDGRYRFEDLMPGWYFVEIVRRPSYEPTTSLLFKRCLSANTDLEVPSVGFWRLPFVGYLPLLQRY